MTDFKCKSTKKQYLKCKLAVKKWEDEFFLRNSRLPAKADIKMAPTHVKESYNQYYKIKTDLLASQILDEEVQFQHMSLANLNVLSSGATENKTNECTERLGLVKDFKKDPLAQFNNVESKTWGTNLNLNKIKSKKNHSKNSSLNNLSQKLFSGSTFKKRNPRKKEQKKKEHKSLNENLITINSQKISVTPVSHEYHFNNSDLKEDCEIKEESTSNLTHLQGPTHIKLNNCTIIQENSHPTIQKVSGIQELASTSFKNSVKIASDFHDGWVERCINIEKKQESQLKTLCKCDLAEDNSTKLEFHSCTKDDGSEDDIINGSDNEFNENQKSDYFILGQKRKLFETNSPKNINFSNDQKCTLFNETHLRKKIKMDSPIKEYDLMEKKDNKKAAILEKKIKSGSLNDNYIKINIEKKIYTRGKKKLSFSKYKKQKWKKEKLTCKIDKEKTKCFRCGGYNNFDMICRLCKERDKVEFDYDIIPENLQPSLDEVKNSLAIKSEPLLNHKNINTYEKPHMESVSYIEVKPLYYLNEDGSVVKTPPEVYETLRKFGHSEFRPGQEEAVMRILSGLSTLINMSTGSGKTLCYQLPAYLYANKSRCITLVISPLVSLMEDQVSGSHSIFKAGCLHSSQTRKQRQTVLENAKNGKLHALLISPETVTLENSLSGFHSIFKHLPPVAFACIDEIHCMSQWSHNFRPSYLMISRVLKEKFKVRIIVGLTATASAATMKSLISELEISNESGIIKDDPLPHNLHLTVSRDENKEEALLELLQSTRFENFDAILIYCIRRDECERLAVLIRTVLQNSVTIKNDKKEKRLWWTAEAYHAGMTMARRKQVQKAFMKGNLRIVVATIAFGMGINKRNIRAVIHYGMPKDFESYVQEVGRAGRDGLPAYCHLFLDSKGRDMSELRRHIYSNSVDRHILRKLLVKVFVDCDCKMNHKNCEGHEVGFSCQETIQALDIPEECIYTLLCYLELHEKKFLKVLQPVYIKCKLKSYKGIDGIGAAASKCPPLSYVLAISDQYQKKRSNILDFNIIEVANKFGWDSSVLKSQISNLQWELTPKSTWTKTGIFAEFYELGFRVLSRGDLSPSELDEALECLIERVENQEKRALNLLNIIFSALDYFAYDNYGEALLIADEKKSNELKNVIKKYFETEQLPERLPLKTMEVQNFDKEAVISDIRTLLCTYNDNNFNGRTIARIFHGIQSPNYLASVWYKCRFWRKHVEKDFNSIMDIAKHEILRMKL